MITPRFFHNYSSTSWNDGLTDRSVCLRVVCNDESLGGSWRRPRSRTDHHKHECHNCIDWWWVECSGGDVSCGGAVSQVASPVAHGTHGRTHTGCTRCIATARGLPLHCTPRATLTRLLSTLHTLLTHRQSSFLTTDNIFLLLQIIFFFYYR